MTEFVPKLGCASESGRLVKIQIPRGGTMGSVFLTCLQVQPVLGPHSGTTAELTSHYSCPESLKLTKCSPCPISYPLTWPDQAFIRRLSSPQASELWLQAWARTKMQNTEPLAAHPAKRLSTVRNTSCLTAPSCCLSAHPLLTFLISPPKLLLDLLPPP